MKKKEDEDEEEFKKREIFSSFLRQGGAFRLLISSSPFLPLNAESRGLRPLLFAEAATVPGSAPLFDVSSPVVSGRGAAFPIHFGGGR